jgi:hypothetical protein
MIRSGILNSRAGRARRAGPTAARALAGATMAALAGLAVSLAAGPVPAFAAQHRGGPAASHSRAVGTGQPMATGRVGPGVSWAHVAVGSYHTCGIRTDATLWCWGFNDYGQLGLGNHANQDRPQQVTTPAAGGWTSVTAGIYYTCATRTDGTVWCWGYNGQGQVGIGNESGQDLPRQVTTPARGGWTSVTASGDATCATRTGGTLWCWGYNFYGQLGLGGPRSVRHPGQQLHADRPEPRQPRAPRRVGQAGPGGIWPQARSNGRPRRPRGRRGVASSDPVRRPTQPHGSHGHHRNPDRHRPRGRLAVLGLRAAHHRHRPRR